MIQRSEVFRQYMRCDHTAWHFFGTDHATHRSWCHFDFEGKNDSKWQKQVTIIDTTDV